MKRTLSSAQTTVPPETLTDPNGLEENLPDPSWIEESFPGTPSEQTSSEPKLLNRSAIDSSTRIPVELNDSCDVKDQHSAPEKSDRSTSATSTATSATNNDEIEALEKFPLSTGTEVPFKLDFCNDFEQDIELSKEKIFKTVEKAALNDDVYAQASLAIMYESGFGVEVDKAKAFEWYHKAVDQCDVFAQFKLGDMYRTGEGVAVDMVKAAEWYQKAAYQGHTVALFNQAIMYDFGVGVEVNKSKAVEWYQKAAYQGHAVAQFNLAIMYEEGDGVAVDKSKAIEWYYKAADQGVVFAQFNLAVLYDNGEGVELNKAKAVEWYRKAATQGHAVAQSRLAELYQKGEGVEINDVKAFEWYHKAADQGNLDAQFRLAELYQKGECVEINDAKAFEWYQKAARQGDINAQEELTEAYRNGVGVAKSLQLATYWMLKPHVSTASFNYESIELLDYVPAVLLKFPDLRSINLIHFHGLGRDEEIASIAKFIRANSSIKSLNLPFYDGLSDDQAREFVKALEFNTQLTKLEFDGVAISEEIKTQITTLLAQNRYVGELRNYAEKHPLVYSAGFPLDIVNIMVDQMIVSYLKSGQSKEATQKAIDEFLMSVSVKALQDESII